MLDAEQTAGAEKESPFAFDELFFSRTNESGIILAGNTVFQRVSCYSWDEMINKPHKLIRHPDMPKAVFWLLWDTIKKGMPIGAFVKNQAKDGRFYWVFAIVTPVDGGYLSVRVKPSGALFRVVEQEYRALREKELSQKLTSQDSAEMLLARLEELGFHDYPAFMSAALSEVLGERNKKLGLEADFQISQFNRLLASAKQLLDQAAGISKIYETNEFVSLNMRIQAAQLGDEGASLCVISENYTLATTEIREAMTRFMKGGKQVAQVINEGLFLVGTSQVQDEVCQFFEAEETSDRTSNDKEMEYLSQQRRAYSQKAARGLRDISKQVGQFQETCKELKQLVLGLEVTRIMGKIESATLSETQASLENLINDLGVFQRGILDGLKAMDAAGRMINDTIERLLKAST